MLVSPSLLSPPPAPNNVPNELSPRSETHATKSSGQIATHASSLRKRPQNLKIKVPRRRVGNTAPGRSVRHTQRNTAKQHDKASQLNQRAHNSHDAQRGGSLSHVHKIESHELPMPAPGLLTPVETPSKAPAPIPIAAAGTHCHGARDDAAHSRSRSIPQHHADEYNDYYETFQRYPPGGNKLYIPSFTMRVKVRRVRVRLYYGKHFDFVSRGKDTHKTRVQ